MVPSLTGVRLVLVVAAVLTLPRPAAAIEWSLDAFMPSGRSPSVVRLGAYALYVSYQNGNERLTLASRIGECQWTTEVVSPSEPNGVRSGVRNSIAIDPQGNIHIAYLQQQGNQYELRHAVKTGGSWTYSPPLGSAILAPVNLVLDATGAPHVSYCRSFPGTGPELWYATRPVGQAWQVSRAFAQNNAGVEGNSIAIDPNGTPHIAFSWNNGGSRMLGYVSKPASSWVYEPVDAGLHVGRGCSLAFTSSGGARISYEGWNPSASTTELRYARKLTSGWSVQSVAIPVLGYTALALNGSDLARIAFWSLGTPCDPVRYAYELPEGTFFVDGHVPGTFCEPGPLSISKNASGEAFVAFSRGTSLEPISITEAMPGSPDVIPPNAITDLHAVLGVTTIGVAWTAPGDDGSVGQARNYDVRYRAGGSVNEANWDTSIPIPTQCPWPAGYPGCAVLYNLKRCSLYGFAMKTRDNAGNWSAISNSVQAITKCSGNEIGGCDFGLHEGPGEIAATPFELQLPNPLRSGMTIAFAIPDGLEGATYRLDLHDLRGRRVALLGEGTATPGPRSVTCRFDSGSGTDLAKGVYFLRLRVGDHLSTRTVIIE